jgi:hypothetical protein
MNMQLKSGRKLFTEVLAPAAGLSENWTWLGILCFPQVEDRSVLIDKHGISPIIAQFILTKEELSGNADSLQVQLNLKNTKSAQNEYEKAVVLCVALERMSYETQVFSYQKCIEESLTRIVGEREVGDVMGVGGGGVAQLAGADRITFFQPSGKPLGSLPNILFWNDEQMKILSSLRETMFTIIFGDFGGGKTSVLDAVQN